jgi:transposase IS481 family protein
VELSSSPLYNLEAFVSHAIATLTPITRLRLARLVVESGWTYAAEANMFMVAPRTSKKWADRYRANGPAGPAGMADRSSRPHHCPSKTPARSFVPWIRHLDLPAEHGHRRRRP